MTNELAYKYLKRIRNLSASLFFVHLITVILIILFPIVFTFWLGGYPIVDPSNPSINQVDPTFIASIIFPVLFIVCGLASLVLAIINIVHCCLVKINNEMIMILIIFSALSLLSIVIAPLVTWINIEMIVILMIFSTLSLLLIVIAPLVTWIFAIKYRKKIENLQTAVPKKSCAENLDDATKEV